MISGAVSFHAGQKIYRIAYPPPLLLPATSPAIVVVTSDQAAEVSIRRHYSEAERRPVTCHCQPPCATSRVEYYHAGVLMLGKGEWQERLLRLSE